MPSGYLWLQKGNCEITLNCLLLSVVLWLPYPLEIWNNLKGRCLVEDITINVRIILKNFLN